MLYIRRQGHKEYRKEMRRICVDWCENHWLWNNAQRDESRVNEPTLPFTLASCPAAYITCAQVVLKLLAGCLEGKVRRNCWKGSNVEFQTRDNSRRVEKDGRDQHCNWNFGSSSWNWYSQGWMWHPLSFHCDCKALWICCFRRYLLYVRLFLEGTVRSGGK